MKLLVQLRLSLTTPPPPERVRFPLLPFASAVAPPHLARPHLDLVQALMVGTTSTSMAPSVSAAIPDWPSPAVAVG
jgi:hypothetical protein